jgi:nucleoside-diphosphate-sugar epimerase
VRDLTLPTEITEDHGEVATFLLTGCAGFIGSHLSDALLARGDHVLGLDAFRDYYSRPLKELNIAQARESQGFELIEANLENLELDTLVDRLDGIFHLAAQPGVRGSWGETFALYARDNVIATQRVFEAAIRAHVRVVWASSSSVYGNAEAYPTTEQTRPRPISPYGVTKLSCEHLATAYAETFELDHVALRYFTVYGPGQRPDMAFSRIGQALAEGTAFPVYGTGDQTRDVTFVADAVSATLAAMELAPRGSIYNIGGGSETSLNEVISMAERLTGRRLEVRREPAASGDVRRTAADITRAQVELAWRPNTPLEDGLRAQLRAAGIAIEA